MKKTLLTLFAIIFCSYLFAQELVQWRGDNRDGHYKESELLKKWPEKGPKLLWHYDDLGAGHSSAAVSKKTIFISGTIEEDGYIFAFNQNGKLNWKSKYGEEWFNSYEGVRSTPLIYGDKLYIMSSYGNIVCMNTTNGKHIWSVNVLKDYDGRNIQWGVTENLLIDDNKLYCSPGGTDANIIALNPDTGKLIWKSKGNGNKSAYCSPILIKLNNQKLFVTMMANAIMGIDASTGKLLWQFEHMNRWAVHANSPLYKDGYLYCVSGYGKGGVMLKLADDGTGVTEVWRNTTMDAKMGGIILHNGRIYGSGDNSRKWACLDWKTGKELYTSKMMKKGSIIFADGLFYCYGQNGKVGLVDTKSGDYKLISSFKVPFGEKQHWTHLTINNKKLYVRHGNSLMVYSIAK